MNISTEKQDQVAIVSAEGRLDAVGAPEVENAIKNLVREGSRKLVFDMAQVAYISSAGLRCLLVLVKTMKSAGGTMVLSGLVPSVREVMAFSGFDSILSLADDRAAALGLLK